MFASTFDHFASTPLHLLFLLGAGAISYVLTIIIYRLYFHPLAKYPGPIFGRLTRLHSAYHAYIGDRHLEFERLHQRYGPIVRFGPDHLSFNSAEALQTIYGFKSNQQKSIFYSAFPVRENAWSTHSAIDKSLHARKRRVLSHAFSENAMTSLEKYIQAVIKSLCDNIAARPASKEAGPTGDSDWSTPRNMAEWANYMSYDVLGELCYGQSFNTIERPDNRFAMRLVAISSRFHYICGQFLPLKTHKLDRIFLPHLRAKRNEFMNFSRARLTERMRIGENTDRRDFFHFLLNAKDAETGQGFTQGELWGESNVLLIAGSDTTSTSMSATLFYLLHNPKHLKSLTTQVRSTFSSVDEIVSGPTLGGMRYLRACIDEAMRISPPVPALLPREVLAGGMTICGEHIPAGTVVGTPTFTLHRNKEYYPEPLTYKPERWTTAASQDGLGEKAESGGIEKANNGALDSKAEQRVKIAQSAFAPFSIGARGCVGKSLAYRELHIALARLLWLFDLRLAPGMEKEGVAADGTYELRDIFVAEKTGPFVQFRRREIE